MGAQSYIRGGTDEDRFWPKVDKRGDDECWEWLASLDTRGYGNFSAKINGQFKVQRAHRFAWSLVHGGIEEGKVICHRCDNRKCVNVNHLFIGTQSDNMIDCRDKGRLNDRAGERNGNASLTSDDVNAIRSSSRGASVLARRFGVSQSTIRSVIAGESWRVA